MSKKNLCKMAVLLRHSKNSVQISVIPTGLIVIRHMKIMNANYEKLIYLSFIAILLNTKVINDFNLL